MKTSQLSCMFIIFLAIAVFAQLDWTWRSPLPGDLNTGGINITSVVYGNNMFVGFSSGSIVYSTDGLSWNRSSLSNAHPSSGQILFLNNEFISS